MKKIIALLSIFALLVPMAVPMALAEDAEFIPAPYAIDEELAGPTEYLAPVFYENSEGPTIGVTLVGVIVEDGLYFKDSDNDQELDAFEDWRLDVETRVADLIPKLTEEQRIGLLAHQMNASPAAVTIEDALDENGNVLFSALMNITEGDIFSHDNTASNSTGLLLGNENRSGVIRANTDVEVGALYNNATNMVAEYGAVAKKEPMIPYTMLSNPMNNSQEMDKEERIKSAFSVIESDHNWPGSLGFAAAAMGDNSYDLILKYAELDRQIWDAKGIDSMYGPQIDLITDPRWKRNGDTYTEVPEVMAGIAEALVKGYQSGTDGTQDGDVALIMKHFPGDGAAENGFESHAFIGQWRIYATEGSLEKYQLPGFQAAIDAGLTGIMPGFSRPAADGRTVTQSYRGVVIDAEEIANAYNKTILQTLLREAMGFTGFVNDDSNVVSGQYFGAEEMTVAERYAAAINAGSDIISDGMQGTDYSGLYAAFEQGLVEKAAFDRATTVVLTSVFSMGRFENPYRDPAESKAAGENLTEEISALQAELNRKSIVLLKNHDNVLPLSDTTKKVFVQGFMAGGSGGFGAAPVDPTENWKNAFSAAGFTLVDAAEEADVAFLGVEPGGISSSNNNYMNVLDLVDGLEVEARSYPLSQAKSGDYEEASTLLNVKRIAKIAETMHANGGIVIASIKITNPWLLTNLEPYCDGLIAQFSSSTSAQMDVLTGAFNPTGKMPVTMPACEEVIAVNEVEMDGTVYEICVSPNDVPGYEKDLYMAPEVLEQSPSGSYAYLDDDGNIYSAWFGLSYE